MHAGYGKRTLNIIFVLHFLMKKSAHAVHSLICMTKKSFILCINEMLKEGGLK